MSVNKESIYEYAQVPEPRARKFFLFIAKILFPELADVLHTCNTLNSEMIHFINQMQYYITFEVSSSLPASAVSIVTTLVMLTVSIMTSFYYIIDKISKNIEIVKFITTALKTILTLVKLHSLVAKCCKMQKKISLQNLEILCTFVLRAEN